MKRYIFLLSIGAILCIGAQIILSIQVHPENGNALIDALPAIICLMVGGATTVSGLLGLAENYESLWIGLPELIETKYSEESNKLPFKGLSDARQKSSEFWKAYCRICFSVCLTLGGILAISAQMVNVPLLTYLIYLIGGTTIIGLLGLSFGGRALSKVRASHVAISNYASLLQKLPDISEKSSGRKTSNGRGYVMWTNRSNPRNSRRSPANRSSKRTGVALQT
ncbi:MAG: hypothetical protein VX294_05565 [Candidatus Latescibacterota bacterium]|nr:hypothetical protein [Candidatus Latescibacterota bacterium]